jgi:hypothetical protein
MKINIYKNEELFISVAGTNNPLAKFFMNKDFITDYKFSPDLSQKDRYNFKYIFNEEEHLLNVTFHVGEAVLNNYRMELLDE